MQHLRKLGPNSFALITGKGAERKVYIAAYSNATVAGKPDISVRRYDDWPNDCVGELMSIGSDLLTAILAEYVKDACKDQPVIENKATPQT